jgi:signal transduction histidine kinase
MPREEALAKGLELASRALELDPALPMANLAMGKLLLRRHDYAEAIVWAKKAIALNVNDPEGYAGLANILSFVNRAAEAPLGMPVEQILGLHLADLPGGSEVFEQHIKPLLDRCFEGEEVSHAGWVLTDGLGRRYLRTTVSPLRPHAQRVEAALVIRRDFTEQALASEALREAEMELAHVTRVTTLGEVTASFAHELNQPLAAIVNNANACLGLLPNRRRDLDEVRDALADIVSDAERASAIIDRVRGLAQRSSPEKVPLQLEDVVRDVVALTATESDARGVAIRTDVAADLPVVLGDRVQLQQVLLNLIVNGMDAMSAVPDRQRLLEIRGVPDRHDSRPAARISVQDCGIGLGAAETERLFDAFYTTKPHGMGMGLAISRTIIAAHGGRLWAEPNQGPGVTFSFSVPAADVPAA